MARRGVRIMTPRNKKKTWAMQTAAESGFWDEFEARVKSMTFAEFKGELERLKNEVSLVKARELIEIHAPSMAAALKTADLWRDPTPPAPWREELGESFQSALVSDDAPVLDGKLPLHPRDFPLSPAEADRGEQEFAKWKEHLRQHDIELYEAGRVPLKMRANLRVSPPPLLSLLSLCGRRL